MRRILIIAVVVLFSFLSVHQAEAAVTIKEAAKGVDDSLFKVENSEFGNLPTLGVEDDSNPVLLIEYTLVDFVINPIFFVAAGVAMFMILWAAKSLLIGTLMEEELAKAKKTLIWALVGLVLITFSYTIVRNLTSTVIKLLADPQPEQTEDVGGDTSGLPGGDP